MKHQLLLTLGLLMTSLSFGQTYFSKQEVQEELKKIRIEHVERSSQIIVSHVSLLIHRSS